MNLSYIFFNLSFIKVWRVIFVLVFFVGCSQYEIYAQEKTNVETKNDTLNRLQYSLPSPKGAMIRSILFPGWGQWYNGKKIKAVIVFAAETGIIGSAIYWNRRAKNEKNNLNRDFYADNRNLAFWYLGVAILLSMADAFVDAHLAGFDVSPELGMLSGKKKIGIVVKFNLDF